MFAHKSLTLILDNGEVDVFETILSLAENHASDLVVSEEIDEVRNFIRVLSKTIEGTDDDCAG